MKEKTGYPSIDKTHEEGLSFMEKHPIIPGASIYNVMRLMTMPLKNELAVNCLNLDVKYSELIDDVVMFSRAFKELGIKQNDIITISMDNYYQALAVFFAANRIGAVATFLNAQSTIEQEKNYLNLFESPLFINAGKNREYNESIMRDTKVRQTITLDINDVERRNFSSSQNFGYNDCINFSEIESIAENYKKPMRTLYSGKQDALILYTSGTTGIPKSVVITNENIVASGMYMKNSARVKAIKGEKCLICVPFCYPYGFITSTIMSLLIGRTAVLAPNIGPKNIAYYYKKNPNFVFGSPALLEMTKRNIPEGQSLASVHTFISGGDFLTPSQSIVAKEFFKEHGADVAICNGSGNAETVGASTNAVGLEIRPETVGKILTGTDPIVINPDTGEELKYGEEGMLCISGKHVFKEYYKRPDQTEEAKFQYKGKTYVKTGSGGKLSEDGYFELTSRMSRFFINSELNKVYCDRVQNIIAMIDCVETCAVVKVPDEDKLFTCKAYIKLKPGYDMDIETLNMIKEKCSQVLGHGKNGEEIQLKPFEIPSSFEYIETFPRNDADKIDYKALEDMAAEETKKQTKKLVLS